MMQNMFLCTQMRSGIDKNQPKWSYVAPKRTKMEQNDAQTPPRWHSQLAPRWAQGPPKMLPRGAEMAQGDPKMAPRDPRMDPRWAQEATRWPQKGAKMPHECPGGCQNEVKMANWRFPKS